MTYPIALREQTDNKGTVKNNNIKNQKDTQIGRINESNRINNRNTKLRLEYKTKRKTGNKYKNQAQTMRIRGGNGSEEEDLYFVSSDDDTGAGEESERIIETTATKKRMKVTNENLPFGHIYVMIQQSTMIHHTSGYTARM